MKALDAAKEKLSSFTSLLTEERKQKLKDQLLHQALPTVLLMAVMLVLYLVSLYVRPGWITYGISTAALIVIWMTAVARINDIAQRSKRCHVRRLGLLLCVVTAVALMAEPLFPPVDFPSWSEVMLRLGYALTWLTTPNMPPWWKYISGEDRRKALREGEEQL